MENTTIRLLRGKRSGGSRKSATSATSSEPSNIIVVAATPEERPVLDPAMIRVRNTR